MNLSQLRNCFKEEGFFPSLLGLKKRRKGSPECYGEHQGIARLVQTLLLMNRISMTFAIFWAHRLTLRACLAKRYGTREYSTHYKDTYKQLECFVGYYMKKVDADPDIRCLDQGKKIPFFARHMMDALHAGLFMQSIFSIAAGPGEALSRVSLDSLPPLRGGGFDVLTFYSGRFALIEKDISSLGGKVPDLLVDDAGPPGEKPKADALLPVSDVKDVPPKPGSLQVESQDGGTALHGQETPDVQASKISHIFRQLEEKGIFPPGEEKRFEEKFRLSLKSPSKRAAVKKLFGKKSHYKPAAAKNLPGKKENSSTSSQVSKLKLSAADGKSASLGAKSHPQGEISGSPTRKSPPRAAKSHSGEYVEASDSEPEGKSDKKKSTVTKNLYLKEVADLQEEGDLSYKDSKDEDDMEEELNADEEIHEEEEDDAQDIELAQHDAGVQQDDDEVEEVHVVPNQEEEDVGSGAKRQRDGSDDDTPSSKQPKV